jgi:hypothetical protein
MDLWDQGWFKALVDNTENEALSRIGSFPVPDKESRARGYNARLLSGRLRSGVQTLTNWESGGVLTADNECTKTGRLVLDVLKGTRGA